MVDDRNACRGESSFSLHICTEFQLSKLDKRTIGPSPDQIRKTRGKQSDTKSTLRNFLLCISSLISACPCILHGINPHFEVTCFAYPFIYRSLNIGVFYDSCQPPINVIFKTPNSFSLSKLEFFWNVSKSLQDLRILL